MYIYIYIVVIKIKIIRIRNMNKKEFLVYILLLITKVSSFSIGVITDTHIVHKHDPWSTSSRANIWPISIFTRDTTYAPLGRIGNKSPLILLKSALAKIKELGEPDLLIYCGDFVDSMDNLGFVLDPTILTRFQWIKNTLAEVAQATQSVFPTLPVGYVIGNHDKLVQNYVPLDWLPFKKSEYQFIYDIWLRNSPNNKQWVYYIYIYY